MRKSPTIQPRICKLCGKSYVPTGTTQQFCDICKKIKSKETKLRYYRKMFPDAKPKKRSEEVCCICGGPFSSHFEGKPYCNLHYLRMKTNGTPELTVRKSKNDFVEKGNTVICKTSSGVEFLISASDLDAVKKYTWCISKTGYLVANINGKTTKLHRYLLSPEPSVIIDHINGNTLDNRRGNLRLCSPKENSRNSKKKGKHNVATGVSKTKSGKFRARISVDRKEICLGTFQTAAEAIDARRKAEIQYFGNYSPMSSRNTSTRGFSE